MASLAENAGWLFGWLLRNSAQAAVLVLVVWLLERTLLRRLAPRWRYGLWLVVIARLLIPIAPGSPLSLFNLVDLAPSTVSIAFSQVIGLPSPVPVTLPETVHPLADTPPWFLGALALWLPGAVILGILLARDHQRVQLAMDASPVLDEATLDLLVQSKAVMGVRRPVELSETTRISSPAICGWWHPRILLPVGLLRRLSQDETRFLFLHELAHVKRGDIALNWLLAAVQILHWFNPFVWLALRRLLSVREEVCDDLVLRRCFMGASREYGLTLIRILEECAPRRLLPAYAAVLDDIQALRERVRSIRDFPLGDANPWAPAFLTVVLGVAGLTERADHNALSAPSAGSAEVRRTARPGARGHPVRSSQPFLPASAPSASNDNKPGPVGADATDVLLVAMRQALSEIRVPNAGGVPSAGSVAPPAESQSRAVPAGTRPRPVPLAVSARSMPLPTPAAGGNAAVRPNGPTGSNRAAVSAMALSSTARANPPHPVGRRPELVRPFVLGNRNFIVEGAGAGGTVRSAEGGAYAGRQANASFVAQRRPAS